MNFSKRSDPRNRPFTHTTMTPHIVGDLQITLKTQQERFENVPIICPEETHNNLWKIHIISVLRDPKSRSKADDERFQMVFETPKLYCDILLPPLPRWTLPHGRRRFFSETGGFLCTESEDAHSNTLAIRCPHGMRGAMQTERVCEINLPGPSITTTLLENSNNFRNDFDCSRFYIRQLALLPNVSPHGCTELQRRQHPPHLRRGRLTPSREPQQRRRE